MAASLGGLVVSLGLDAAEFVSGLTKSQYEARKFAKNVERDYNTIRSAIKAVASAAAVGFAAQAIDGIAAYKDLSEQISDTAANVASLRTASDLSGRSLDEIAAASVKLTAALSKQDDESKGAGAALAAINLPLEEFKRLNPVAQLDAVAKALATFEDTSEKTAVAVALFGKTGATLLPFFNDLAEAGTRNAKLTDDQIEATDQLTKDVAAVKSEFLQTAQVLLADLIPALSETVKYFRDAEAPMAVLEAVMKTVGVALETLAILGANVTFVLTSVAREIAAVSAQAVALANLDFRGFSAISEAVKADGVRARAELDAFERRILRLDTGEGKDNWDMQGRSRPRIDASGLATGGDKRATEAERYLISLQKQAIAAQDLSAEVTALFEIESGRLGKVGAAERDRILLAARTIDTIKMQQEEQKRLEEIEKNANEARKRSLADAAAVYEATRTPAEELSTEIERLNRLLEEGVLSWDTYARAQLDAQDKFDKATKEVKKKGDLWDEFAKNAARGVQEHLGDGLFNIMKGNFESIGDSFVDMILRMVAEAQAAQLARWLLGDLVEGGKGSVAAGGLIEGIFGIFAGGKAGGGPVDAGRMYRVSENRPEMLDVNGQKFLMMGNQRGHIDPNPSMGGGRALVVNNNFTLQGNPSRQTQQQIAAAAGLSVSRATRRNN